MSRSLRISVGLAFSSLALAGAAQAGGGARAAKPLPNITFNGGTPSEQQVVIVALQKSAFPWQLLPKPVTVTITTLPTGSPEGYAWDTTVVLDKALLQPAVGEVAYGMISHEFGHVVDGQLLTDPMRVQLWQLIGGDSECVENPRVRHDRRFCERFASSFAWVYWPQPGNVMNPRLPLGQDETFPDPLAFRALLGRLLGFGDPLAVPAPKTKGTPKIHSPARVPLADSARLARPPRPCKQSVASGS